MSSSSKLKFKNFYTLVLIFVCAFAEPTPDPAAPQYVSYNSSDLSYLSNGIQFPVHPQLIHELTNDNASLTSPMLWMQSLYSHYHLYDKIDAVKGKCRSDIEMYLEHLSNGTLWAAKMYDASGRYNDQFFFGNDFWIGSKDSCEELVKQEITNVATPFPVRFFVAKIRLNINEEFTPVTRQILIGQCLPSSCTAQDVREIFIREKTQAKSLTVVEIRPVPGEYNILADYKFHIVGGTALVIAVIILIASLTEAYLTTAKKSSDVELQHRSSNNNNNNNDAKDVVKEETNLSNDQGKCLQFLLSFSSISNGRKILSFEKTAENSIRCIHGLRFFSIMWIIMVHTYLEVFSIADNKSLRTVTEQSPLYQTVSNGTFSVDTFFFISGLLVTITYFRTESKKTKRPQSNSTAVRVSGIKFVYMCIYRYIRLTPPYLFVIGVNELVLRYTQNKSVYSLAIIDHYTCDSYWWRNALYINNFFPQHEFCMLWSWYIANDTQFYFLAALLLIIAVRGNKQVKFVGITIGIFMVTSWIITFSLAMKYNYIARVEEPFALFDVLYDKPWLRIGPYLVGMVTGYYLFIQSPLKLRMKLVLPAWGLSLGTLLFLIYCFGREGLVIPLSAIHASLGHTAWGVALAWITIACSWGYGGPINSLLGFRGFLPLSRLTYCAYLIHPVLMVYTSFLMDGTIHLYQSQVLVIFLGNAVCSFVSSLLISLAFEAPVVRILKIIFSPNERKESK